MSTPETPGSGLLSIERVVAFVLGPSLTLVAGGIATQIDRLGGNVSPTGVAVFASTCAAGAAGLVYKWLHGRQEEAKLKANFENLARPLDPYIHGVLGADPGLEGFIKTSVSDLEGLAQAAAEKAVGKLVGTGQAPPGKPVTGDAGGD